MRLWLLLVAWLLGIETRPRPFAERESEWREARRALGPYRLAAEQAPDVEPRVDWANASYQRLPHPLPGRPVPTEGTKVVHDA